MKKLLLAVLAFSCATLYHSHAQDIIPNHSFEEWNVNPVGWNNALPNFFNIEQSSEAQDGSSSVRLFALWSQNAGIYPAALLQSLQVAVTESHPALYGYYKGTSVEGDEFTVSVLIYSEGQLIAATGFFTTSESATEWTPFSVPINYLGGVIPADAYISLTVSGPDGSLHEDTEFFIDNLSWYLTTDVDEREKNSDIILSPNPAVNFVDIQFTLDSPDRMAIEVLGMDGQRKLIQSQADYRAGTNTLRFNTADLPAGIYFVRASGSRAGFTKKFVVGN